MYVRINRPDYTGIYHCDRAFINTNLANAPSQHEVVMESNVPGGNISVIDEKERMDVFVMNEAGETIARW